MGDAKLSCFTMVSKICLFLIVRCIMDWTCFYSSITGTNVCCGQYWYNKTHNDYIPLKTNFEWFYNQTWQCQLKSPITHGGHGDWIQMHAHIIWCRFKPQLCILSAGSSYSGFHHQGILEQQFLCEATQLPALRWHECSRTRYTWPPLNIHNPWAASDAPNQQASNSISFQQIPDCANCSTWCAKCGHLFQELIRFWKPFQL